ncbi:MAG: hypothetical protein JSW17_03835 [Candidatus Omnitrophota bacterium]|nr:MAG: hypothetical protein JSW17_03835 [Candidatus Omnitrophota bacterium]
MRKWDYGFALGQIGVLEKSILPREILEETLSLSSQETFLRLKEGFSRGYEYRREYDFLEEVFEKEEGALKELASFLLKEETAINILKGLDNPQVLEKAQISLESFLEGFLRFYFDILNTLIFLRIKKHNLKEDFYEHNGCQELLNILEKEDFIRLNPSIKNFYYQAKKLIEEGQDYLLEFLKERFLVEFLKEKKKKLLGEEVVFWYYFAKRINLKVTKLFVLGKLCTLKTEKLKRALGVAYG